MSNAVAPPRAGDPEIQAGLVRQVVSERSAGRGSSQSPRPAQSTVERPLGLAAWQSMLHSRMIGGGAKTQPRRRPGATVLLKVPVVITPAALGSADM